MMTRRANGSSYRAEPRCLDRIDRLILKGLQADGRKAIAELAREVHLTTSPCLDRVHRLEAGGYIQGYTARLSPHHLGAPLLAVVGLQVERTTPEGFEKIRC